MSLRSPLPPTALLIAAGLMLGGASSHAEEGFSEFSGSVSLETRAFARGPAFDGQSAARLQPTLIAEPEYLYEFNGGDDRIDIKPYLRFDTIDSDRSSADFRELRWLHLSDDYELVVGMSKVFWGVTESRHLVDVINQTDAAADVDGEDKLGQPMVAYKQLMDWGDLDFFVMPYFRDRSFVGTGGRLRGGTVVAEDRARFTNEMKRFHPDLAVRASAVLGDFDVGLSHFHGTGREPTFELDTVGNRLIPIYDVIDQTGLDVQATKGDWLLKLETIHRTGQDDGFVASTAGFEYTFYGLFNEERGDIGLLAEHHYDGRSENAPATLFDHDLFFGSRFTLNDENDTDLLAGVLWDYETNAYSFSAEFDTRLDDKWSVNVDARYYGNLEPSDPFVGFKQEHHIQVALFHYF